jgi:parallel beta-helix repeat protein
MKKIFVIAILLILVVIGGFILFLIPQEQRGQKTTTTTTLYNEIAQVNESKNETAPTFSFTFNEQDYPGILSQINSAKSEINRAAMTIANRTSDILLDDCQNDICFLNSFKIFQNNSQLDCQGKTIKPKGNADVAIIISANNSSIINCKIDSFNRNAIQILGSGNIITNNVITNNPEGGIVIEGNDNLVFNNNMRDNKKSNVHIQATSKNNIICNNTMVDTADLYQSYTNSIGAISVSGSDNIVLENTIKNNAETGIKMSILSVTDPAPSTNLVVRNSLENCGVLGLEITGAVVGELGSAGPPESPISDGQNIVFNNSFSKSKNEFGLRIRWSNNNKVIGNLIYGNNWQGIHVLLANGNLIEKNTLFDNSADGIWLGNSNNNEIYSNMISGNANHCGMVFTDWNDLLSVNNTAKNNVLIGNGNIHDDKQICDEDSNLISENEFK